MNTDEVKETGFKARLNKVPTSVWMALAAVVLVFGLFQMYRSVTQYDRAREEYEAIQGEAITEAEASFYGEIPAPDIEVDLSSLQAKNPETAAWLYYPAMGISYPVMQDEDNTYYIRHTFEGERNAAGSLFLDCHANRDFNDRHSIIYGHSMKDGSMFGNFTLIREDGMLDENPYFWIFAEDGVRTYRIFSYHEADVKDMSFHTQFADGAAFDAFIDHIVEASEEDTGVIPGDGDQIVTLSTCTSDSSVRLILHGVLVG